MSRHLLTPHQLHQLRQARHHHPLEQHRPQLHRITSRVPQQQQQEDEEWYDDLFTYPTTSVNLVALASSAQTITIQADSKFEWMRATIFGNLHGATPPFTDGAQLEINVFITDSASGRQLMQASVPAQSIAGNGKLPFINPTSRIFEPSATVQVTLSNTSAANQYDNIVFSMIGRKIFRGRRPGVG
jgi:hypothetical protein